MQPNITGERLTVTGERSDHQIASLKRQLDRLFVILEKPSYRFSKEALLFRLMANQAMFDKEVISNSLKLIQKATNA